VTLSGLVWLLTKTLDNDYEVLYAGKPIDYWQQQLDGQDTAASNQAFVVVNTQIVPQLVDTMFHDTNDSRLRVWLVETLNSLPEVRINFSDATQRRMNAACEIGEFGPAAKAAISALVQAVKGTDTLIRETAVVALGKIHSDPETVIPLLTTCLDDDNLNDEAATALGYFGSLAKPAVPKIIPLLNVPDDDTRTAAAEALTKIDPEAYARVTNAIQKAKTGDAPDKSGRAVTGH
jgi:HEAT repeat protein